MDEGPSRPTRIGRYVELVPLGRGGMGAVYRARDPELDRLVAVKLVEGADAPLRERFRREAQALARLRHENVVPVFDVGEDAGRPFFVMELVDGRNLSDLVGERGRLAADEVVDVARQAARGLAAAHAQGIVHRDVKPANVVVEPSGRLRVVDFGLARLDGAAQITVEMGMLGTPTYMAPEQVLGRPTDARTDLYALGATCFHLLAGRPPFDGRDAISVAMKHLHEPLPSLGRLVPSAPAELVRLVERLCAKEPAARPASASELGAALDELARTVGARPLTWERAPNASTSSSAERLAVAASSADNPALAATSASMVSPAGVVVASPGRDVSASPVPPIVGVRLPATAADEGAASRTGAASSATATGVGGAPRAASAATDAGAAPSAASTAASSAAETGAQSVVQRAEGTLSPVAIAAGAAGLLAVGVIAIGALARPPAPPLSPSLAAIQNRKVSALSRVDGGLRATLGVLDSPTDGAPAAAAPTGGSPSAAIGGAPSTRTDGALAILGRAAPASTAPTGGASSATTGGPAALPAAARATVGDTRPTGPVRVVVLAFRNLGGARDRDLDFLVEGTGETVLTRLAGRKEVRVLERAQLGNETGERDLQHGDGFDAALAVRVGRLAGAEVAVQGSFQRAGRSVRVDARFVRVETGDVLGTAQVTQPIPAADKLLALQDAVAATLEARLLAVAASLRAATP